MGKIQSPEMQEYLETIRRYEETGKQSTVSAIADELRVTRASVSEMLRKLARNGLIVHDKYGPVGLTGKGRVLGFAILQKHRIVQKFLTLLGMGKTRAHAEACALEHAVSDDLERRLRRFVRDKGSSVPLAGLGSGVAARITLIDAGIKASQRLADMGLTNGTRILLLKSAPFRGPLKVKVRNTTLALGRSVAAGIFVEVE